MLIEIDTLAMVRDKTREGSTKLVWSCHLEDTKLKVTNQ